MSLLVAASGGLVLTAGISAIALAIWASVAARTPEIGLRRALGASRRDVTLQFVLETGLIGAAAATIGVAVGCAASVGIAALRGWPVEVNWKLAAAMWLLATEAVVLAGLVPARRAAGLEPLTALRS